MKLFFGGWIITIGILLVSFVFLSTPDKSYAQSSGGGLLSCGTTANPQDCTICDLVLLGKNVFNFILQMLAALSVLMFVIGGVYIMLSGANSSYMNVGKEIITNTVIGVLLILGSFVALNTILTVLNFQKANFSNIINFEKGLFTFTCSTTSYFNDRGMGSVGGGGAPVGGGRGTLSCKTGKCANDPEIIEAVKNNKYGVPPSLIMAMIQEGEGCNKDVTANCSNGWTHPDCSCGYSQSTKDWRPKCTGIADQEANCKILLTDRKMDINCSAYEISEISKERPFCHYSSPSPTVAEVKNVAACYNAGGPSAVKGVCGTQRYCERVSNYYKTSCQ